MEALALAPPLRTPAMAFRGTAGGPTPNFPVPVPATAREIVEAKRKEEWRSDPERFLQNSYNQFCSVIMMVTFTGGIQIAALSFMNDFTTSPALTSTPVEIPKPSGIEAWYSRYTVESFGFMLGFNAVFLCGVCGAVAAVNAALISYYCVYPPKNRPVLEGHLLFCMVLLFGTFALSGISLTLLSTNFDFPFMISTVFLFCFALVIAGYQIERQAGILHLTIKVALKKPIHTSSVIATFIPLFMCLLHPMASSWYTIALCLLTWVYCLTDCLFDKADKTTALYVPQSNQALFATALALTWGGCAFMYFRWTLVDPRAASSSAYAVAGPAVLEAILMGIMAGIDWHGTWKYWGSNENKISAAL